MQSGESVAEMETRFHKLMTKISGLGRVIPQKEINLKILRGLPDRWKMKVTCMKENRNLNVTTSIEVFRALKEQAHEFELKAKQDEEEAKTTVVVANQSTSSRVKSNPIDFMSDEQFTLFLKKFKKFIRHNNYNKRGCSSSSKPDSKRLPFCKARVCFIRSEERTL